MQTFKLSVVMHIPANMSEFLMFSDQMDPCTNYQAAMQSFEIMSDGQVSFSYSFFALANM